MLHGRDRRKNQEAKVTDSSGFYVRLFKQFIDRSTGSRPSACHSTQAIPPGIIGAMHSRSPHAQQDRGCTVTFSPLVQEWAHLRGISLSRSLAEPADSASQLAPFAGCAYHSRRCRSLAFLEVCNRDPPKSPADDHAFCTLPTEFGRASWSNPFPERFLNG